MADSKTPAPSSALTLYRDEAFISNAERNTPTAETWTGKNPNGQRNERLSRSRNLNFLLCQFE